MKITISADGVGKHFGGRSVVRDVYLSITGGSVFGIVGYNGSGKSTLVKMLVGLLHQDVGSISIRKDEHEIQRSDWPALCGFVAPYLNLYDEFTPMELLHLHGSLRKKHIHHEQATNICERVGITDRRNDIVRTFSSGMRQRVAIAVAISLNPQVLVLDEPSTTLDERGRSILEDVIAEQHRQGGIVLLATNDQREQALCTDIYRLS